MSVTSVLFDLDGTLVDPAGSITSGIRHALVANGVTDPGEEAVEALVGPPLQIGLRTLDGVSDGNIEQTDRRLPGTHMPKSAWRPPGFTRAFTNFDSSAGSRDLRGGDYRRLSPSRVELD